LLNNIALIFAINGRKETRKEEKNKERRAKLKEKGIMMARRAGKN
jgi:hypothetical protein